MSFSLKRFGARFKGRFPWVLIFIGTATIFMLSLNEETSVSRNYEYMREINRLKQEIAENNDSAAYYRNKRQAFYTDNANLEHIAREQYHMQRPGEEVYIIKE